jgi:hypothetical protein
MPTELFGAIGVSSSRAWKSAATGGGTFDKARDFHQQKLNFGIMAALPTV